MGLAVSYHVEKGYEKWWDLFFPMLRSRGSADPLNNGHGNDGINV